VKRPHIAKLRLDAMPPNPHAAPDFEKNFDVRQHAFLKRCPHPRAIFLDRPSERFTFARPDRRFPRLPTNKSLTTLSLC
jgi:hypothetical protein